MTYIYFQDNLTFKSLTADTFQLNSINLGIGEKTNPGSIITQNVEILNNPFFLAQSVSQSFLPNIAIRPSIFDGFGFNGEFYEEIINAFYISEENLLVRNVLFSAYSSTFDHTSVFQLRAQLGGSPISQIFQHIRSIVGRHDTTLDFTITQNEEDGIWLYNYPSVETGIIRNETITPFNLNYNIPLTGFFGINTNKFQYDTHSYVTILLNNTEFAIAEVENNGGASNLFGNIIGTNASGSRIQASCRNGDDLIVFFDEKVFKYPGNSNQLISNNKTVLGSIPGLWFKSVIYSPQTNKYFALGGEGVTYPVVNEIATVSANAHTNNSSVILLPVNLIMFSGISGTFLIDPTTESLVNAGAVLGLNSSFIDPNFSLVQSVCTPSSRSNTVFATYRINNPTDAISGNDHQFVEFTPF